MRLFPLGSEVEAALRKVRPLINCRDTGNRLLISVIGRYFKQIGAFLIAMAKIRSVGGGNNRAFLALSIVRFDSAAYY